MTAPDPAWVAAGARAVHANECCSDWPSNFCDGPATRAVLHAEAVIAAVEPLIREQISDEIAGVENDGCRRVPDGCNCHTSRALREAIAIARGGAR